VRGESRAATQAAMESAAAGDPVAADTPSAVAGAAVKPDSIHQSAVFEARVEIDNVHVSDIAQKYMVDLVFATRYPEKYSDELRSWIQVGGSPRATIGLDKCSRAQAWLNQRDHVTPDDIRQIVNDVLRHRLMLSYEANADGVSADKVIDSIVEQVAVA